MKRANAVGVQHEEPRRLGHPHRRLVDVLLAGHVRRPGAAVHAALRGPVGLDVDARRSAWTSPARRRAARRSRSPARPRCTTGPGLERLRCGRSRTASRSCSSVSSSNRNSVRSSSGRHFSPIVGPPCSTPPPGSGAPTSPPSTLRRRRPPPAWRTRRAHLLQQTHRAHLFPGGAADGPASSRRRRAGRARPG